MLPLNAHRLADHNIMANDKNLTPLGNGLKRLLDSKTRTEKADIWWTWHGNSLVETIRQLSGGSSLIEALAFAGGQITKHGEALLVDEEFAASLAERALDDPDAYDLALKVCAINLNAGVEIWEPLRTISASALSKLIDRPAKRGRTRTKNWERDILILRGILSATQYDLPVSTSYGSENIGAIPLVLEAFGKAEHKSVTRETITQVWKNRKKSGLEKELEELKFAATSFQLRDQ